MLLVVLPGARGLFRGWRLLQIAVAGALVLALMIVWSVIKSDYREFLNQGSSQQVVIVPVSERVNKLNELVGKLDGQALEAGLNELILRVSYVNYFAYCLKNVPSSIPHEHGALWFGAVKHVLTPRFLFPNKATLDDSERTEYYTGMTVAGAETGTSIGIGYVGESYVDFGRSGMFAPILLLGVFYGLIYRMFASHPRRIVGLAIASAIIIFGAFSIETSNIKLLGGNFLCVIVMSLFAKVFGKKLWQMIAKKQPNSESSRVRTRHRPT